MIEVCQNVVLTKIDITMTRTILRNLDLLLKNPTLSNLKFGVQQITSVRSKNFCMFEFK